MNFNKHLYIPLHNNFKIATVVDIEYEKNKKDVEGGKKNKKCSKKGRHGAASNDNTDSMELK